MYIVKTLVKWFQHKCNIMKALYLEDVSDDRSWTFLCCFKPESCVNAFPQMGQT